MRKLISKALLSIVMDKQARESLKKTKDKKAAAPPKVANDVAAEPEARAMTDERRDLIRNALVVRRFKSKILADLSDDDRKKLYVTAVRALMADRGPEKGGP